MTIKEQLHRTARSLGLLGLLGALVAPSTGAAAAGPNQDRAESLRAADDCAESAVVIQIDTLDGGINVLDHQTGDLNPVDGEIPVYFGGRSQVVVQLDYTAGDWEVEVSSQGGDEHTVRTVNGSVRYVVEFDEGDHVFTTNFTTDFTTDNEQDASAMMNMAPVPPGEIIIMPDSSCPPD